VYQSEMCGRGHFGDSRPQLVRSSWNRASGPVSNLLKIFRLQIRETSTRFSATIVRNIHQFWPVCPAIDQIERVYMYSAAFLSERDSVTFGCMLSPARLSVVCSVRAPYGTQSVEIFRNVSTPFGTLAIR